jgi:hypothetical protein
MIIEHIETFETLFFFVHLCYIVRVKELIQMTIQKFQTNLLHSMINNYFCLL